MLIKQTFSRGVTDERYQTECAHVSFKSIIFFFKQQYFILSL